MRTGARFTAAWIPDAASTVYVYVGVKPLPLPVGAAGLVFVKTLLPEGARRVPFWVTWNGAFTPL